MLLPSCISRRLLLGISRLLWFENETTLLQATALPLWMTQHVSGFSHLVTLKISGKFNPDGSGARAKKTSEMFSESPS